MKKWEQMLESTVDPVYKEEVRRIIALAVKDAFIQVKPAWVDPDSCSRDPWDMGWNACMYDLRRRIRQYWRSQRRRLK